MLRRVLPVAGAAAALVLVPSIAAATGDAAPVANNSAASYQATAHVTLPDGRPAVVTLGESRGSSADGWRGQLNLDVTGTCQTSGCTPPIAYSSTPLTDKQVFFNAALHTASVEDVLVTLTTPGQWVSDGLPPGTLPPGGFLPPGGYLPPPLPPDGYVPPLYPSPTGPAPTSWDQTVHDGATDPSTTSELPTFSSSFDDPSNVFPPLPGSGGPTGTWIPPRTETVTVSVTFTGTGAVMREVVHEYTSCLDGSVDCQRLLRSLARDASGVVTFAGEASEPGVGTLSYGQTVEAAAPAPTFDEY